VTDLSIIASKRTEAPVTPTPSRVGTPDSQTSTRGLNTERSPLDTLALTHGEQSSALLGPETKDELAKKSSQAQGTKETQAPEYSKDDYFNDYPTDEAFVRESPKDGLDATGQLSMRMWNLERNDSYGARKFIENILPEWKALDKGDRLYLLDRSLKRSLEDGDGEGGFLRKVFKVDHQDFKETMTKMQEPEELAILEHSLQRPIVWENLPREAKSDIYYFFISEYKRAKESQSLSSSLADHPALSPLEQHIADNVAKRQARQSLLSNQPAPLVQPPNPSLWSKLTSFFGL
jgi:hypothetical protein